MVPGGAAANLSGETRCEEMIPTKEASEQRLKSFFFLSPDQDPVQSRRQRGPSAWRGTSADSMLQQLCRAVPRLAHFATSYA